MAAMDTITLHAHLLDLVEKENAVAPDRWHHDLRSGAVTYRFGDSPNSFTWGPDAMASMPETVTRDVSAELAKELLERWDAVERMLDLGDMRRPDSLLVDHETDEMTLIWDKEKYALVIGPDEDPESVTLN
jgi:hypothetical protein